jgi:hypothetical protein
MLALRRKDGFPQSSSGISEIAPASTNKVSDPAPVSTIAMEKMKKVSTKLDDAHSSSAHGLQNT